MELFATWTGADFLAFYAVLLLACVGLGFWIPANLRPDGRMQAVEDAEDLAVLTGGAARHAVTVLADLLEQGAVARVRGGKLHASKTPGDHSPAASTILRKSGVFTLGDARRAVKDHADTIRADLVRRGLMLANGDRIRLKLLTASPSVALLLIGLYRQQAGAAEGEPTGFLILFMGVTLVALMVRLITMSGRTIAGDRVLADWRERSSRLRRAPERAEIPFAVGLFGTAVLVGTPLESLHAMKSGAAGSGGTGTGGCGTGGSAGDSGCGGGGCGGCGG